jgi:hypothetical protein
VRHPGIGRGPEGKQEGRNEHQTGEGWPSSAPRDELRYKHALIVGGTSRSGSLGWASVRE